MLISLSYFMPKYSENATSHNLHNFWPLKILLQWVLYTFLLFAKLCENVVLIHIAQQKRQQKLVCTFL